MRLLFLIEGGPDSFTIISEGVCVPDAEVAGSSVGKSTSLPWKKTGWRQVRGYGSLTGRISRVKLLYWALGRTSEVREDQKPFGGQQVKLNALDR
jgi:hypothetical protein